MSTMNKKQIIVIASGWVVIGDTSPVEGGILIEDASVIRAWGTTKGIGEIALNGPTKSTVLDYAGRIHVLNHAFIMRIDCIYDK